MTTSTVFSAEPEPELHDDAFTAATAASCRLAAGGMDDDFDQRLEERLARDYPAASPEEYLEFMRRKVEKARVSMRAGLGRSHAEVEAHFAARHARVLSGQR